MGNDEVQRLLVEVFEKTGYKMTADDPTIIMMLIQRREMMQLVQQHEAQQQSFLDKLTEQQQKITQSAAEFRNQKQLIVGEILQANTDDLAVMQSKLYSAVNKRIQEQFEDMVTDFMKTLEMRAFRFLMILLIVQVGVLLASLIL